MRRGLLTLISITVFVWNALAQDQTNQAKYELIRETINFLATDKAVSQDTNFRISCETLDYDCFRQQLSKKSIAGIERWYNSWRSMTAADEAGLTAIKNQIFADIFDRPGKGYRKQLAGYEAYISRVEHLLDLEAGNAPLAGFEEDTVAESVLSPAEMYPIYPEETAEQNEPQKKENPMIAYLAIVIAIIALIIVVLPILKKREQPLPGGFQDLHERLDELTVHMQRLETNAVDGQIKDAIASLTDIMEAVEKRVVELENKSNPDRRY